MPFAETQGRASRCQRWRSAVKLVLAALGLIVLVGAMASLGGMATISGDPAFCGSCHEMEPAFEAWRRSSHCQPERGKVATCQDCHHPPGLAGHVAASLRGVAHLSAHLFRKYDERTWAEEQPARARRARELITNSVCVRCHVPEETAPYLTTVVHSRIDDGVRCVDCHRNLMGAERVVVEEVLADSGQPPGRAARAPRN